MNREELERLRKLEPEQFVCQRAVGGRGEDGIEIAHQRAPSAFHRGGIELDTKSPTGRMLLTMFAAVAEWDRAARRWF